jgi:NAD(P)-dependent dehydrogenase (short-subunit alcohol dehydrogenase family)
MDVGDEVSVDKAIEGTVTKYGRIDVLVSNAGIQIVKPIVDFPFPGGGDQEGNVERYRGWRVHDGG